LLDISATFIRNCVKKRQSIRYMVPDIVDEMIRAKGFFLR
jgi:nicotinate-nucleotide adenylyltransferase